MRVLGANLKGRGALLHAGVDWSVEHGMHVANLSLSSKSDAMFGPLHEVADEAYFAGTVAGLRGQQPARARRTPRSTPR